VNVLKPHLQTTIWTLLDAGASQREIERVTGIDRKTIRAYKKRFAAAAANSAGVSTEPAKQFPPPCPTPMRACSNSQLSSATPTRRPTAVYLTITEELLGEAARRFRAFAPGRGQP
jgi:hypothetical protein